MKKKQRSLLTLLLVPLSVVIVLQGFLLLVTLVSSGTKQDLENNAVSIDQTIVENRDVVLESAMVSQWSLVRTETDYINEALDEVLAAQGTDATTQDFLASDDMQSQLIAQIYPELLDYLQRSGTTGIYAVLGNTADTSQAARYNGFFLRDSDPTTHVQSNSDLQLERGDKNLARQSNVALDSSWDSGFSFKGAGNRASDSFFYTPYLLAQENPGVEVVNLAYWATPFILEDNPLDNHKMIAYSVPLIHDGVVYGVVGVEVSVPYLTSTYFSVRDLDSDQHAGYALAVKQEDGTYRLLMGVGSLYDSVARMGSSFGLADTQTGTLKQVVDGLGIEQGVYCITTPLTLYSNNVPFEDKDWVVCGFVSGNSVYGLGSELYTRLFYALGLSLALSFAITLLVTRYVTRPVYRFVDSVGEGIDGLRAFAPSGIREVDELHRVVTDLTEGELRAAAQLGEEKERYRMAVESSKDIFITYREQDATVEVVNSHGHDGAMSLADFLSQVCEPNLSAGDLAKVRRALDLTQDSVAFEVFARPAGQDGIWYAVSGRITRDEKTGMRQLAGYLRDVTQQKNAERERELKQVIDPTTGLYRRVPGMRVLERMRAEQGAGTLLLIDLDRFSSLVSAYGLVFGDVVLAEFSKMLAARFDKANTARTVIVRVGADEFLVWLAQGSPVDASFALSRLRDDYRSLVRDDAIQLGFSVGYVHAEASVPGNELVRRAACALDEARSQGVPMAAWNPRLPQTAGRPFGDVVSQGETTRMNIASLGLSLYDHSVSFEAASDLLAWLLSERFGLTNLVVIAFQEENLAASLTYSWRPVPLEKAVFHYTPEDYHAISASAGQGALLPLSALPADIRRLSPASNALTIAMTDNGRFADLILFEGVDAASLGGEENKAQLVQLASVIQNRLNLERHDQSAKAKADFLARMSHEIRTPMNGIIGMTEIALQDGQTSEARIDCLHKVQASSHYLLGLLNDILDMSKIESGKMTLVKSDFDLRHLVADLRSMLDVKFAEKHQTFTVDLSLDHDWVYGDALRINQVLINLLGNAIKYSPKNTEVTLEVREVEEKDGRVRVFFGVRDQGVGISEQDHDRIFRSFERLEGDGRREQGTGLGLSISNRLVHMMGGRIDLESEVGRGSFFSFELWLPVAEAQVAAADVEARSDFTGVHVLVAEDNELNREILRTFLEGAGCVVTEACDGREAVDIFSAAPAGTFQLVLMDVMMPNVGGLEAAHLIRSCGHADAADVPIVAVSANAFDEDIKQSLASGMNAHLSKPVEREKLFEMMGRMLASR